jgi:hypothetical protein
MTRETRLYVQRLKANCTAFPFATGWGPFYVPI